MTLKNVPTLSQSLLFYSLYYGVNTEELLYTLLPLTVVTETLVSGLLYTHAPEVEVSQYWCDQDSSLKSPIITNLRFFVGISSSQKIGHDTKLSVSNHQDN